MLGRFGRLFQRCLREQGGLSLIELMVASTLMIVIVSAILGLSEATQKAAPQDQERALGLHESATGVSEMSRDMRLAYSIIAHTGYTFEANIYEKGASVHVLYDCTGASSANPSWGKCTRTVIGPGGPTSRSDVLPYFTNTATSGGTPVFTYTQNGSGHVTYVAVHVEVPTQGRLKSGYPQRTVYDDGVYMRNLDG